MIVNLKKMAFQDEQGFVREEELARLESTMQNIADVFEYRFSQDANEDQIPELSTFLTYNHRHKTISTVKKEFVEGGSLSGNSGGMLLGPLWQCAGPAAKLLWLFPAAISRSKSYLRSGPHFDFSYHPSLGPLYSIISQKLRKGRIARGSQLHLSVAELDCENLELEGRLSIIAQLPMGHLNSQGKTRVFRSGRPLPLVACVDR